MNFRTALSPANAAAALVFPLLLAHGVTHGAPIAYVSAQAGTHNSTVAAPTANTSTPGEIVTSFSSASYNIANNSLGSVDGMAVASADYGVNRIYAFAGIVGVNTPGKSASAWTGASANSSWEDTLTVTGGTPGDLVSTTVFGTTTYNLSLFGGVQAVAPAVSIRHSFFMGWLGDSINFTFTNADFVAGGGQIDWSATIQAKSGVPFNLGSNFSAAFEGSFMGLDLGDTSKYGSFDSMHTSVLRSITLPQGYGLTSASGALVSNNGGFAYQAALVPEPQSYILMLSGLATIAMSWRRRVTPIESLQAPLAGHEIGIAAWDA